MRTFDRVGRLSLLAMAVLAAAVARGGEGNKVEVREVRLADFEKTIKGLKGKVMVVNFWTGS
jgi:hypothetical protein